ncbi:MAG: hypothetical protein J0L82_14385 [Deltaproteobacteria bacterium]|nr:hypothetical protein [Deltaproteobacteria bacterium]
MLKTNLKTHLMIFSLFLMATLSARAADQCRTVPECQARIAQDQATIKEIQAGILSAFLDIAKNDDGTVKHMNHNEAIKYCIDRQAHLPSARELAHLSMSLGAKGIAEIKGGKPDESYRQFKFKNSDGTSDNFYFSREGYQRPEIQLRQEVRTDITVRASSIISKHSSDFTVFLNLENGNLNYYYLDSLYAVLCAKDR